MVEAYNSVQIRKIKTKDKNTVREDRVVMSGRVGFKKVTLINKKGKKMVRKTAKKKLTKWEMKCIRECRFIPGLFDECLRTCLKD
jgi:hypothetical protein